MITFLIGTGLASWSFLSTRARWRRKNGALVPIPICMRSSLAFIPVAIVTRRLDWLMLFCTSVWNHCGDCSEIICVTDKVLAHVVPVATLSSACWDPAGISGLCYSGVMFYCKTRKRGDLERNGYHASIHVVGSACAIVSWMRRKK